MKTCKQCNKIIKSRRYCSDTCRHNFYYETVLCLTCNKPFISLKKRHKKYCSHECMISNTDIKERMKLSRKNTVNKIWRRSLF